MSDEIQQPVQPQEQKEERVDELDIIGGVLIKFFQKIINSLKNRNNSQNH